MEVVDGALQFDHEVDDARWVTAADAAELLTYERDVDVLRRARGVVARPAQDIPTLANMFVCPTTAICSASTSMSQRGSGSTGSTPWTPSLLREPRRPLETPRD